MHSNHWQAKSNNICWPYNKSGQPRVWRLIFSHLWGNLPSIAPHFLQISSAGRLARELVTSSTLFPAYRSAAVSYDLILGGQPDPTVQNFDSVHEGYVKQLLRAAHAKALRIVMERQAAIR